MWNYNHAQRFQAPPFQAQGPQSAHELLVSMRGMPISLSFEAPEPPVPGFLEDVTPRVLSLGVAKPVPDLERGATLGVTIPSGSVIHRFDARLVSVAAAGTWVQVAMPRQVETVQRRQYTRVKVSAPMVFAREGGSNGMGQILDLSPGGLRFTTQTTLATGDHLYLSFSTPDGAAFRGIEATVVRVQGNGDRVTAAVQFGAMDVQTENELVLALLRLQGKPMPGR